MKIFYVLTKYVQILIKSSAAELSYEGVKEAEKISAYFCHLLFIIIPQGIHNNLVSEPIMTRVSVIRVNKSTAKPAMFPVNR